KKIGLATNAPFSFLWIKIPAGNIHLTAKMTGKNGVQSESKPVNIRVHISNSYFTFGLDRVDFLTKELNELPLWQYLASLIYVIISYYLAKTICFVIRVYLKKWAEKTEAKWDDYLVDFLKGPIKILSFLFFLYLGLQFYAWPVWLENLVTKGLAVVLAIVLTMASMKAIDLLIAVLKTRGRAKEDKVFDAQLFPLISTSLKVFVVILVVLVTSDNLLGINIRSVIASLSIASLALGLAAQDTLANLFGAVAVFVDKPFRVGDRVKLTDVDGVVETIGIRSTRVRNLDGFLITVPNKTMGNATITNISRRPNIKTEMNIGITYDTPAVQIRRAIEILEENYKGHPMTCDLLVAFNRFGDSALNILVVHWWNGTDFKEYSAGMQGLHLKLKAKFDEEKIQFAFPSQTVYMRQDSAWVTANSSPENKTLPTNPA
ncbi:MAG: Low conductance mechanosensitive channel YnaI, partial [Verrucomicrobiales bacterium]|nr:Low conductance mechanosensitive channel YnaI [Verrucomicrobiales bacterium]